MSPRKKEIFEEIREAGREKILMAAFELFADHGYSETSMDRIAQRAKISKGLIYHYFSSKEELLKGLFNRLMTESEELIKYHQELSPAAFLDQLITFSIKYVINRSDVNRLLISLTVQPAVVQGLQQEITETRKAWIKLMTDTFTRLGFHDPESEAFLLGAMLDGIGIGYLAIGADYPVEKVRSLIAERYDIHQQEQ